MQYLVCTSFNYGNNAESWIFEVCDTKARHSLKSLGELGWELCQTAGDRYVFKRG